MRHAFAVAPRSYALHGRGGQGAPFIGGFSAVVQPRTTSQFSPYSQTTAPAALRVGRDAKRILAQFHIQIMTQPIDYNILLRFCSPSQPRRFRITLLMNQLAI